MGTPVFNHVGDHVDFRMPFDEAAAGLLYGRPIEFTETAAECDEIVVGELLAAKQDDQVIEPGAVDDGEVLVR